MSPSFLDRIQIVDSGIGNGENTDEFDFLGGLLTVAPFLSPSESLAVPD